MSAASHAASFERIDRLSPAQLARLERRLLEITGDGAGVAGQGDRLVAFVTTPPGTMAAAGDLRQHLASRLPAFMVPSAFEVVESLPLLPNGKVDRNALAAMRHETVAARDRGGPSRVEAQLMRIWDELLDLSEVSVDDNFFERGGHSLLVPRLVDRLHADFGVTLPLGAVFQTPTIRGLASLIEEDHPTHEWKSLVGIREQGTRSPLYMVHGLGGEIGYFYNLAQYLNPDQPVYGLQAPVEPFDEIETMAAQYLEEIRRHQPEGPYQLGGYCVGGCVAYEMARQLADAGETVTLLAVVDSVMPGPRPLLRKLRSFIARPIADQLETVVRRTKGLLRGQLHTPAEPTPTTFRNAPTVFHATATRHYEAQRRYAPKPYRGNMWLFRSHDNAFDHDLGWGVVVRGRVEVRNVPGPHADVLKEPFIEETARQISAAVEAVSDRR